MKINSILDKTIKILLVSVICIMLTIGAIFVLPPSFAYDLSDLDSLGLSYELNPASTISGNSVTLNGSQPFRIKGLNTGDVLAFDVSVDSSTRVTDKLSIWNGGNTNNVITSDLTLSANGTTAYCPYGSSGHFSITYSNADNSTLFFAIVNSSNTTVSNNSYSLTITLSNISFNGSTGSGGGSSNYIEAYTDVKAGYVAYILVGEDTTVELTTQFPEYSRAKSPYWDSVARYNEGLDELPTQGTTYTDTTGFSLNWEKLSTDTNAFGQTKSGYVIFTDISAGYFVVYNPTYRSVTSDGRSLISPTIRVWTSDTYGVAQFPINTRVSLSSDGMTWLSTQVAGGYVATSDDYNSSTDEWSYHYPNSTESAIIPNGGGNALPADMTIQEYLQSIGNTLSGLVNDFLSIFAAPLNYIQALISAGSAFMTAVSQFFVWLPSPIYTLLITALILVIVIGVIKLLFK